MARVAVTIVTHNSANTIETCLHGVLEQTFKDIEVLVVDNASTDDTATRVRTWTDRGVRLVVNARNEYFARAHNRAIDSTDSELVLTLNPDVIMYPDYIARVVAAFESSPRIGGVNGKLLLTTPREFTPAVLSVPPAPDTLIDGSGIGMQRSRRAYLRGNREPHGSTCFEPALIFGVDAACGAFRRAMLQDVAVDGEYFDEDFLIYREDVDLAWRAQRRGWESWYEPSALAYHIRTFHVGYERRTVDPFLRRHSVKNGWLLMIKHEPVGPLLRDLPCIAPYQLKIVGGLLTVEWSSLPAVTDTLRLLPRMLSKRRSLQQRQLRSHEELRHWFP